MSKNKEVKKVEKLSSLDKNSRIFLFLREIKEEMSYRDINNLYLDKYKLSKSSKRLNIRVVERFLGEYSKYSKEKKEEINKVNMSNFKVLNIDYLKFKEEKLSILKEKSKRSNILVEKRVLNFKEIEKYE